MTKANDEPEGPAGLRQRAHSRLSGAGGPQRATASVSAALGVLHDLASSPETAADALALLQELQVHQVELDLQAEELSNSRAELESVLQRQRQLYDCAPVGFFTVDRATVLHELNLRAAALLGVGRDALLGRRLESFLAPHSGRALQAMLARVDDGSRPQTGSLELAARDGAPRVVQASVVADPAGSGYLVAFMDLRGDR